MQLFPLAVADATPAQSQAATEALAGLRAHMRAFLDAHAIREERSGLSALWTFRTALDYAWWALEEIAPARLAAYGPLDAADAEAAAQVMNELQTMLKRLAATLDATPAEQPHA